MKTWLLPPVAGLLMGAAPAAPPRPVPDVLRRPGETTVFAFTTRSGKTVSLCEGPHHAYLVYRFGTAARVELQCPAVLNASSWCKFTYNGYRRIGGVANAGEELHRLSFENEKTAYHLLDETYTVLNRAKEEDSLRKVCLWVEVDDKDIKISGNAATTNGDLYLRDECRGRVKLQFE